MHTEGVQNLPKLNVRPSFKIKRDAKNPAYNLTNFKGLKFLRINHETWKICEWSSKQHLEAVYQKYQHCGCQEGGILQWLTN